MEKETLEEASDIERIAMDKLKNKWGHLYTFGYPQRPFPTNYENDLNNIKIGLYEGTKWQAERMYSEAIEFAEWIRIKNFQTTSKNNWIGLDMKYYTTRELFEQFKKK